MVASWWMVPITDCVLQRQNFFFKHKPEMALFCVCRVWWSVTLFAQCLCVCVVFVVHSDYWHAISLINVVTCVQHGTPDWSSSWITGLTEYGSVSSRNHCRSDPVQIQSQLQVCAVWPVLENEVVSSITFSLKWCSWDIMICHGVEEARRGRGVTETGFCNGNQKWRVMETM